MVSATPALGGSNEKMEGGPLVRDHARAAAQVPPRTPRPQEWNTPSRYSRTGRRSGSWWTET